MNILGCGSGVGTSIFVVEEDYSRRQTLAPTILDGSSQFGDRFAVRSSCSSRSMNLTKRTASSSQNEWRRSVDCYLVSGVSWDIQIS